MSPVEFSGAQQIDLGGHALWLLPDRAAWHPSTATLFIADVHFGKALGFRALGLPVPSGTTRDNLRRIDALVRHCEAARVVFLGDLFHSAQAQKPSVITPLEQWRDAHPSLRCVLVRGNHDAHAGDPPAGLRFEIVDEPWPVDEAHGLLACHHPRGIPGRAVLAGHLHPALTLRGPARDRERLRCFCRIGDVLILPSFGEFTGSSPFEPPAGSVCYPVGDGRVWPALVAGRA